MSKDMAASVHQRLLNHARKEGALKKRIIDCGADIPVCPEYW